MKARKRPIIVDVEGPLTKARNVPTAHGPIPAEVGDYVLTDPRSSDTWPIKAHIYAATYDVLEE